MSNIVYINMTNLLPQQPADKNTDIIIIRKEKGRGLEIDKNIPKNISIKIIEEPEELLKAIQKGDVIKTSSLVNISRSAQIMIDTLMKIIEKGARLISTAEEYDSDKNKDSLPFSTLLLYIEDRDTQLKLKKKNKNKKIDKRKNNGELAKFQNLYKSYKKSQITKTEFAKAVGISRPTLDKWIEEKEGPIKKEE